MIDDLWQLHEWHHASWMTHPTNPRSRTIIITGARTQGLATAYRVVFQNSREQALFTLKYADFFKPMDYIPTWREDPLHWWKTYHLRMCEYHVKYSDGPKQ